MTKKPTGRPTKRTPEVIRRVIEGLSNGTPLTVICAPDDMPSPCTVRLWMNSDDELSNDIAGAREAGFDKIAVEAMAIADGSERDTIALEKGGHMVEIPDKEWIMRTKLRVETRLKLLAKWDPKRYGDKITQELTGSNGGPIATTSLDPETEAKVKAWAADIEKTVQQKAKRK